MPFPTVRLLLPISAALSTMLLLASPAFAEGEDCVRDTDCESSELCLGGVCAVPETPPPTCEAGCEIGESCDDGFCKVEGVACDSPAGRCWVEQDHGLCECVSGEGAGWTDGFNPDDPPQTKTDDEMFTQCGDTLAKVCGTEAPSLPDTCVGDVLAGCEAFLLLENAVAEDCGETVPEVGIARLSECCNRYDEPDYADYRECLGVADVPTCEVRSECANDDGGVEDPEFGDTDGGSDPTEGDDNATAGDTDSSAGEVDQDTSSCSIGGDEQGWALLGLFALLPFARRRR
ncbi:MAG: hypothetical protein KUG77_29590 [Nannocystaceae bacterium]|nr:hypothetical protein [Nannocystaceae bacterium]